MTNIDNLSAEIAKALSQYSTEVTKGLEESKKNVAKNAVSKLRKVKFGKNSTGDYSKGWRVSKIDGKQIIHNKTNYQITHLLEFGHAKVNGGRVAARPHIRPVEEQAIKEFTDEVEKVIKV